MYCIIEILLYHKYCIMYMLLIQCSVSYKYKVGWYSSFFRTKLSRILCETILSFRKKCFSLPKILVLRNWLLACDTSEKKWNFGKFDCRTKKHWWRSGSRRQYSIIDLSPNNQFFAGSIKIRKWKLSTVEIFFPALCKNGKSSFLTLFTH